MTSAFELKRELEKKARVVVVSRQKEFVYIPPLIWVPFGRRTVKDITFSAQATFKKGEIVPGVCVLDARNKKVVILTNRLFPPRKFAMMLPNLFGDWTKVLVEKSLMMKCRQGWSFRP